MFRECVCEGGDLVEATFQQPPDHPRVCGFGVPGKRGAAVLRVVEWWLQGAYFIR
jgi:hypothetical protein